MSILSKKPVTQDIVDLKSDVISSKKDNLNIETSKAGGLLANGTGLLGKATDETHEWLKFFKPDYYYDRLTVEKNGDMLDGVAIGFKTSGYCFMGTSADSPNPIMAISPSSIYKGFGSVLTTETQSTNRYIYTGFTFFDLNGKPVTSSEHQHYGLAKLAKDLHIGTDDYMYITRDGFEGNLDPNTEWYIGDPGTTNYALRRGVIFWDYYYNKLKTDDKGNYIPFTATSEVDPDAPAGFGYSKHWIEDLFVNQKNLWEQVGDYNGYTNVWRHPIKKTGIGAHRGYTNTLNSTANFVPKGTKLSQNWHGGTYKYCFSTSSYSVGEANIFYRYKGYIGLVDYSGTNRSNLFPPGAAGVRWMMLMSYATENLTQVHSNLGLQIDNSIIPKEIQHGTIPEHVYYDFQKIGISNNVPTVKDVTNIEVKTKRSFL